MFNRKLRELEESHEALLEDYSGALGRIEELEDLLKEISTNQISATTVLESIMDKGIAWDDYENLPEQHRRLYFVEAQRILDSEVFKNEYKRYISDIINFIASKTKSFEEVSFLRASINGLESFKERLESIVEPNKEEEIDQNIL